MPRSEKLRAGDVVLVDKAKRGVKMPQDLLWRIGIVMERQRYKNLTVWVRIGETHETLIFPDEMTKIGEFL